MAVSRDLLEILVCPETKQPVSLASAEILARLRRDAEAGSLRNRGGQPAAWKRCGCLSDRGANTPARPGDAAGAVLGVARAGESNGLRHATPGPDVGNEMLRWIGLAAVKRATLLFWAAWLSAVTATNVLDALRAVEYLPRSFAFASGNWGWINQVMDPREIPRALQGVMFAGAIAWEALAAALFWRGAFSYCGGKLATEPATVLACGVNLALWGAFQVLDEVVMAYQPEAVHRVIFLNQLATIVMLEAVGRTEPEWQTAL